MISCWKAWTSQGFSPNVSRIGSTCRSSISNCSSPWMDARCSFALWTRRHKARSQVLNPLPWAPKGCPWNWTKPWSYAPSRMIPPTEGLCRDPSPLPRVVQMGGTSLLETTHPFPKTAGLGHSDTRPPKTASGASRSWSISPHVGGLMASGVFAFRTFPPSAIFARLNPVPAQRTPWAQSIVESGEHAAQQVFVALRPSEVAEGGLKEERKTG